MKQSNYTKEEMWDIIIIGAGASGLMAALQAAKSQKKVLILEHMESAGKKILVTGNGKCNYTNLNQDLSFYRGENPDFVASVFEQCSVKDSIQLLKEIGIYPKEKNGYVYPYSEQAASVLEAFLIELDKYHITPVYNAAIRFIKKEEQHFVIETKTQNYYGKSCILATGGKAAKKTGSDGSGYIYATRLGHTMIEPVPSLVQLIAKEDFFKKISGIRIQAQITIKALGNTFADAGEVQLTDYGVSGIPVFQVSRYAAKALKNKDSIEASLDFLPSFSKEETFHLLKERCILKERTILEIGIGLFPKKLFPVLLNYAHIKENKKANQCTLEELQSLVKSIKHFDFHITGTKSFDFAQVTAGGINTQEVNPKTLESNLIEGLYFAGEILDIDGACGGYNLQWAWSSGCVSARSVISRQTKKEK